MRIKAPDAKIMLGITKTIILAISIANYEAAGNSSYLRVPEHNLNDKIMMNAPKKLFKMIED